MSLRTLTASELAALSGVRRRTLLHWIHSGVLDRPIGRGRGAHYTRRHLLQARAIRALRAELRSLSEIKRRVSQATDDDLLALVPASRFAGNAAASAHPMEQGASDVSDDAPVSVPCSENGTPAVPPEPSYPSHSWDVVALADGLVLLVNPEKGPIVRRIASEIYRYYGRQGR